MLFKSVRFFLPFVCSLLNLQKASPPYQLIKKIVEEIRMELYLSITQSIINLHASETLVFNPVQTPVHLVSTLYNVSSSCLTKSDASPCSPDLPLSSTQGSYISIYPFSPGWLISSLLLAYRYAVILAQLNNLKQTSIQSPQTSLIMFSPSFCSRSLLHFIAEFLKRLVRIYSIATSQLPFFFQSTPRGFLSSLPLWNCSYPDCYQDICQSLVLFLVLLDLSAAFEIVTPVFVINIILFLHKM